MNQQSIKQSIDYILKYNLQYLPKKELYQYLQHIALATKKTDAASAYQNAIDELSPENAATHAAPKKAENEVLAAVDAVLKEYPDSRWKSASAWLNTLKGKRYPGGNGGIAIAMRCVVSTGNVELLKFVLNENYNKEYIIHNDKTALMFAAQKGYLDCVKELIKAKANVNTKNKAGETAIWFAIGQPNTLKEIINAKADVNVKVINNLWTPLMYNAQNGHTECVKALIAGKADLNLQDKDDWSALMSAARNGHTECVKALIAGKADLNLQEKDGWSALRLAARYGHTECVKALIAGKADLNLQDKDDWSALMGAARNGHTECVKALIAGKADLNLQDKDGWSALMCAAFAGHDECVNALIAGKADLNQQQHNGGTALMEAAEKGHFAVVVALLQAGAYIYAKNKYGKTAETIARENNHTVVLTVLVAQARYWKNCFAMINYGIAGLFTALVIISIMEKSGMIGSSDDIAVYVTGCLVPIFIKAWGASKAIGKPVGKKSSFFYGTSDFLCVMALCLPALSHNTVLGKELPGFAIAAILVHITMGVLWYEKTVKQAAKANTLVIWNFATAAVLMYLAGGVITGSYSVFGNLFAALTLGYFN